MMRQRDADCICAWHVQSACADLVVGSKMHGEYGEYLRRIFYPLGIYLTFRNAQGGCKK